jgi:hypothetical protein
VDNNSHVIEYEEMILYSITVNQDLFGTVMFRYIKEQLYRKFMDIVSTHRRRYIDSRLMDDIRFYARFLAMIVTKMNVDRLTRNICFDEKKKQRISSLFRQGEKKQEKRVIK